MDDFGISGGRETGVKRNQITEHSSSRYSGTGGMGYESSLIGSDFSGAATPNCLIRKSKEVPQKDRETAKGTVSTKQLSRGPENREALRQCWMNAQEKAAQIREASKSGDYVELGNSVFALCHSLDDMWELRESRERDWAGVLNFLQ